MATITHGGLMVCTDCTFILVNDDDSGMTTDPAAHRERMAQYMADLPGNWVHTGEEPDPFSDFPCDACGTRLAGERFDFVVIR